MRSYNTITPNNTRPMFGSDYVTSAVTNPMTKNYRWTMMFVWYQNNHAYPVNTETHYI
jgi:hypothetical protein